MYASLLTHPSSLFGQFDRLRRDLDDVFGISSLSRNIRSVASGSVPAVNVGRTSNSFEVYVYAPGLEASKIDVNLDRGVLQISGEREANIPAKDSEVQVYANERVAGRFTRSVSLPEDIDPTRINAVYRDGVLQVSIARIEAALPTRVPVL